MDAKKDDIKYMLVDNSQNRPEFIKKIFENDTDFTFLKKIDDSTNGKSYRAKIYEIEYDKLEKD